MTTIPDTSTEQGQREASVMLATLMGVGYRSAGTSGGWFIGDERVSPAFGHELNLYDPANMALAWRVLNWAWVSPLAIPLVDWAGIQPGLIFAIEPAEAQRAWLDKILSLAIEAGMIPKESDL